MEPEPQGDLPDSPPPDGERLADEGMEMERLKLLKQKTELEAKLAVVLWEEGKEPSEDDQLSWKMRLREIELELDGKTTISRADKCICLDEVDAGSRGSMCCAKCGTPFHTACVAPLLAQSDTPCPHCSHNMMTGEMTEKQRRDQIMRSLDAARAAEAEAAAEPEVEIRSFTAAERRFGELSQAADDHTVYLDGDGGVRWTGVPYLVGADNIHICDLPGYCPCGQELSLEYMQAGGRFCTEACEFNEEYNPSGYSMEDGLHAAPSPRGPPAEDDAGSD